MNSPKKILIVEDEVPLLDALYDRLTSEGYAATKATNGQEGLDSVKASQPDLILLDINMPVMDGMTMLKELRKTPEGKGIEVILLTNYNDYKLLADALAQGAHDYLVKSDWSLDDVAKLVREKLK
jgi:two-component system chemotaxis response regulator CheY